MVIYGVVSNTSIGYLFMAGVIPGLLLSLVQMGVVAYLAKRRDFPVEPRPSRAQAVRAVSGAAPALMMPVILLGGIYSGAVTPTEAAAVAAGYALIIAFLWYRTLTFRALVDTLVTSAKSTAVVAITIAGALLMNWVVAAERIPDAVVQFMFATQMSPDMFLFLVTVLFLVLGMFLDTMLMLLIVVPILMPTGRGLGIDPVHFGVVSVVNMMIGLVTPPMGQLVFLIAGVSGIAVTAILREVWIFLIALIALLFVLVYVPELSLWLPIQMGYEPITP
jgi:tripartite ATP-independent transporter DctM subunit